VFAWDAFAAASGSGGRLAGAIALAALACGGTLAPLFAPAARFWLAAASAAQLSALVLFAATASLRSPVERESAALFVATTAVAAVLALVEAAAAVRAHGPRDAPLTARFALAAVAGLGVLLVGGWLLGSRLVVQGGTEFVPTQFNTALSLVAIAVAAVAALHGRRTVVTALVLLLMAQAALTLLQEFAGVPLVLDELLWRHAIVAENVPPGRMAPNTALALLAGAAGVLAALRAQREPGWWAAVWGCGLMVAAIALLAAAGFALQILRLRAWGEHTPIALPSVLALAALAVALLALGLGHLRARTMSATVVPVAFAIGALVLSIYTWNVLATHQAELQRGAAVTAAQSLTNALRGFLSTRLGMFQHMAERLAPLPDAALEQAFRADARRILRDFPGLFSVSWLSPDGTVAWIESPEGLERFQGTQFDTGELRSEAFARARETRATVLTPPLHLRAGGHGFAAIFPVVDATGIRGFLSAGIRYQPLLDAMLATTALGYRIELRDGGGMIYVRDAPVASQLEVSSSTDVYSRPWLATLRPAQATDPTGERLPELVLFAGLLLGGVLAVALRLALLTRARAAEAEAASAALRVEAAERERAQRALEQSRNELSAVLENSPDGFQLFDHDWRFVYVNPVAERINGRPRSELLGQVLWDAFPEAALQPITEPLRRAMATREPQAYESFYAPFGRWFGIVAFPHPTGLAMFVRDVTEQHDQFDRVVRSEYSLMRAQRIAGIGSWELTLLPYGRTSGAFEWSEQTFRIFGLEPGIVPATMAQFERQLHAEDRTFVLEALADAIAGRHPLSLDHRIVRPDGTVRHVHQEADFICDAGGRPVRLVGIVQDVTARKSAEEELRLALEGMEARNQELQDFAFVASHDLQEPLRKIRAFGERLADRGRVDAQGADYIERMRHAAARMQTLIDDLLAYSRVATRGQAFAGVDLEAVAREVLTDLESAIEAAGATVRIGRLPLVDADATQMRQLLQNLLSNSLKFRSPARAPVVTIDAERFERPSSEPGARRERWCRVIVRDNGIGFDNRHRDRIMQPFQRLHGRGEYEGTGIGLAIVRRIVDRHGGTIEADGVPGAGATFTIELPLERLSARSDSRTTLALDDAER
jgi:PAS domain S-box-containing protein